MKMQSDENSERTLSEVRIKNFKNNTKGNQSLYYMVQWQHLKIHT